MRLAFLASFLVHAALLAALLITLPSAKPLATPRLDALPVELVTLADETDLTIGDVNAEEVVETPVPETVEAPEPATESPGASNQEADTIATDADALVSPEQSAAPEPAASEPPAEAVPDEPVEETEVAAISPEPARVPETVVPRRRPPPPPRRQVARATQPSENAFNADRLSSLINRTGPSGGGTGSAEAGIGTAQGQLGAALTQSELDALRAQMERCYNVPVGLALGEEEVVFLDVQLAISGEVVDATPMPGQSVGVLYDAAVRAAQRAVLQCQPYILSADKYDQWKTVRVRFDPPGFYR